MFEKCALSTVVGSHSSGLGFGCMGITAFYGDPLPDDEAMKVFQTVYDGGCRHFDTAEIYAAGELYNEAVLGKFLATVPRDSYTVGTKYWPKTDDYSYETVKPQLEASLKRLGLEYVDLYYAHRCKSLDGAMDFCKTGKRLQEEGLIKEIGLSEIGGPWLRKCYEVAPVAAVQQEWSLVTRNLEDDLIPACKDLGVIVVAYSPLSRSLLSSNFEAPPADWRGSLPRFTAENLEKNKKISEILEELSKKYNCTTAQLALAWIFAKAESLGVTVVPIPGTTKIKNATSNMKSTSVSISDPEDMKTLETLAELVAGARGPEWYTSSGIESQK